jgi:outer membrane receptor for ferrienterochelin and colicins
LGAVEHLETVEVTNDRFDVPLGRINRESVVKRESVTKERVLHKNATSLARALDLEPGVQTTLTCANCGSQRITLNGLRGENTTVLIDGIPAFSSVSSFYGMEAIPMAGIADIEVMRGAGSSLTAPESIGGAINLVTARTDTNRFSYLVRGGENQSLNQQFMGTYGTARGGVGISAQTNRMGFFDVDDNNVAESSTQNQKSVALKFDRRLGDKLKFTLRGGLQELELLGGATEHYRSIAYPGTLADETDFENGDVREDYLGDLSKISDRIKLERRDTGGAVNYHFDSETNVKAAFSLATQIQDSVYSHGYDYDNVDHFRFFDLRVNRTLGDSHLLTVGLDHRNEEMSSSSEYLYKVNNFFQDSFHFDTLGAYVQEEWFLSEKDELNLVLRMDRLRVNWKDQRLQDPSLEETAWSPRIHYKRIHSEAWSSRLSFGIGYRAPLTLFESQHGTNEEGFEIAIDDIETAETYTYTLNFETEQRSTAVSGTLTRLRNMAYGDEDESPIVFRNAEETFNIGTMNIIHVERITPSWTLEGSFDWFILPDSYKEKLPIAAQELRTRLVSDYHFGKNELVTLLNVVGPRNLRKYRYDKNFNVLSEDLNFEDVASSRKSQSSPLYFTVDLFFSRQYTKSLSGIMGVTNLFDYTQTSERESPLSWRQHGDHYHLDNRHLWGPVQGRVVYAGLQYTI